MLEGTLCLFHGCGNCYTLVFKKFDEVVFLCATQSPDTVSSSSTVEGQISRTSKGSEDLFKKWGLKILCSTKAKETLQK